MGGVRMRHPSRRAEPAATDPRRTVAADSRAAFGPRGPACDRRIASIFASQGGETMAQERTGVIKFKGNPMTLIGPALKPGDKAPDFSVLGAGLTPVNLSSSKGKVRFFSVVPSLDTGICNIQTKKFSE